MATDKPLVSVYMPNEVYEALKAYQEEHGIKSASSAVVEILAEYFGTGAVENLGDRLGILEGKFKA